MNELSRIFLQAESDSVITLEKNRVYSVRQDDSFELTGYYCSNTAKLHENPQGLRRTAIYLREKKNIVIDGNGATVLVYGKMTPMLFDRCKNITVKNLTVDYAVPTMTEFEILSSVNGVSEIKINPDCRYRVEGNDLLWLGADDCNGLPYWQDSHNGKGRYFKIFNPSTGKSRSFDRNEFTFEKVEELGDNVLRLFFVNKEVDFPAGCVVQTRSIVRDQTGSFFERCKNLKFEKLRVRFMHGLGMVSQYCENVSFTGCDFTPAQHRTIASTADFFQFSGCRGQLKIENCKAWGAQDDYINVHGTHLRIIAADSVKKQLTVRFMHAESWGFQAYEKGDEIEFIRWDTLIPYAKASVTGFEKLNNTDILLTVDNVPQGMEIDRDVIENASWTPDLHVCGCEFGATSGRGVLCTTRGKVIIENNSFTNLWGPALLIEDDCNFWFESGYTKEIIFRNNTVNGCSFNSEWEDSPAIRCTPKVMDPDSGQYVHAKLVLESNTFLNPNADVHCLWLEYIREVELKNNIFDRPYKIHAKCVGSIKE